MDLSPELQLGASLIIGLILIGGAVVKYFRDINSQTADGSVVATHIASLAEEMADIRQILARLEDRVGDMADGAKMVAASIDAHRRAMDDLRIVIGRR